MEKLIRYILQQTGRVWSGDDGDFLPDESDVQTVLDKAAEILYDEPVGTRLEVGGMIIEKQTTGFDVYTYTGFFI